MKTRHGILIAFMISIALSMSLLSGCSNTKTSSASSDASVESSSESTAEKPAAESETEEAEESSKNEQTSDESSAKETSASDTDTQDSSVSSETDRTSTTSETTQISSTSETTQTPTVRQLVQDKKEGHYQFQNIVCSSIFKEIMGQQMYDTYCALVTAVLAGETSFACPDQDTYNWVMGQFPDLCFPILHEYITTIGIEKEYENGTGYFQFTIPYEEFQQKLADFETMVTDILNEALEDDYSDVEKCLALYTYFADHYTYDYELEQKTVAGEDAPLSAYRFFTAKSGICQEISVAYSYLLLQAGVDATVMKGVLLTNNERHQWSYVTINGKNYHIDPTWAVSEGWNLSYFLMTDTQRINNGQFDQKDFIMATVYSQDHEIPEYHADDETYSTLWGNYVVGMDPVQNQIKYMQVGGEISEFTYEDYNNN